MAEWLIRPSPRNARCAPEPDYLERVANGESLTVTLDGRPVAELRPLPSRGLPAATWLARWRYLPLVNPAALRADIDRTLDASL